MHRWKATRFLSKPRFARLLVSLVAVGILIGIGGTGRVGATARHADRATGDGPLLVIGDTVRGAEGLDPTQLPLFACVVQSRFPQGSQIVFRMKVFDPETGQAMDDSLVTSLTLSLPDGTTQAFKYGGHPGGPGATATDYFWTTAWKVPADYPTGTLDFQVTAEDAYGRTGAYQQFNVAPSLVQIVAAQ